MQEPILVPADANGADPKAASFYRRVLEILHASGLPFLVGGAYALSHYTGISRHTKDLDVFIRRKDYDRISNVLSQAGYETELTYPHWLAKIRSNDNVIDIIFNSGNGVSEVDDAWFDHAGEAEILGIRTKISPIEEMIWSKAFIMERERFDGADVVHLIRQCADRIDWERLRRRFEPHWRMLMVHLVLFGFVYPAQRHLVPTWLMDDLLERLRAESHAPGPENGICQGTLISREQYLPDVTQWGYQDARLMPSVKMEQEDIARWTEAISRKSEA